MTATKKGCSNEPGPAKATPLNFNTDEIRYLKQSWEMATSTMDIGCELVARLLNDNRTRFRELIESHSGEILGAANITAEDVRKIRRARAVGGGVVIFFNQGIRRPWQKGNVFESLESLGEFFTLFDEAEEIIVRTVISQLDSPEADEVITRHSQHLGASHFRMKVWFQAENWLCVKNCLLDTIMTALAAKKKGLPFCWNNGASLDTKKGRECWYKVIHYVIHNMKKGFLAEALSSDSCESSNPAAE